LLEGFENSIIWQSLQEDQDRSEPSTLGLEARTGQRNVIPETPSDLQEISGNCTRDPIGADEAITTDELKDKLAYITYTLQISRGAAPGTPDYKKSICTFEDGDPQQWMEVMTGLREIWLQNSVDDPMDMSNTVVAILKGNSLTAYEAAMEDLTPDNDTQMIPLTNHVEKRCVLCLKLFFLFALSKHRSSG
jgi:hypothetical protein